MVPARVERRLAAIMAADVVGYSRLMEADEAGTFARLKRLRTEVVEPILAQHGGRVVDLKGDGAIVEFRSAVDAVEAAVAAQRAMLDQDPDLPEDRRIRFRVGINLGDVIVDGGTIYGDGVNIAARIESLCEPGGVWLSRSVHNQVKGKLDLGFAPSGRHQVKNINEPVETFRVALEGAAPVRPARNDRYRWHRPALITACVMLALVFAGGVWRFWPAVPPAEKPTIAVLPFDSYGGDEAVGRLADGITEDIITDLARFRDLDVIARNSTEVYKGKAVDVREVARDLGVGYVLEGSIQRGSDRLRVTAQLIDARTGAHVWADRWDRAGDDLFTAQSELAERVASSIGGYGGIAASDRAVAKRKRPGSLSAYELYLLGIEHKHRMSQGDVEQAKRLFDDALAKDPKLARAHVGRAWAHSILVLYGPPYDYVTGVKSMETDARAALALDPQHAEAHAVLGESLYSQGRFGESSAEYDRALLLNPSSADIAAYSGALAFLGQPERAAASADRALRLNPNYPAFYPFFIGPAYFLAGRPGDAARILASLPPDQRSEYSLVLLAGAYAMMGEHEKAAVAADEVRKIAPAFAAETALTAKGRLARDQERQLFVEAMRKAGLPVCAAAPALAGLAVDDRLPECEAERAKPAGVKS